jgi:hypothetical protein
MTIGRDHHELMSVVLAQPHIGRLLHDFYPNPIQLEIMRSLITECIAGHMATQKISSLEAGIVLVADGCDMIGGRARIPMKIAKQAHVGDIHRYSAASITDVQITKGEEKPVRIVVAMSESAGFFQIENVLMPKIQASPAKSTRNRRGLHGMEPPATSTPRSRAVPAALSGRERRRHDVGRTVVPKERPEDHPLGTLFETPSASPRLSPDSCVRLARPRDGVLNVWLRDRDGGTRGHGRPAPRHPPPLGRGLPASPLRAGHRRRRERHVFAVDPRPT